MMASTLTDSGKILATEMRHFSNGTRDQDTFLTKNSGKVWKHIKQQQGMKEWASYAKTFRNTHVNYVRISDKAGFLDKKRFGAVIPKDETITYMPTYKSIKKNTTDVSDSSEKIVEIINPEEK